MLNRALNNPAQACVSQNSRRLFGPEKLLYAQAIYQQRFSFPFFWKLSEKILGGRETLHWFSGWELYSELKEIEFQTLLSGAKSLRVVWETHAAAPCAGKYVRAIHDWFWFYFWLVDKVARDFLANHKHSQKSLFTLEQVPNARLAQLTSARREWMHTGSRTSS